MIFYFYLSSREEINEVTDVYSQVIEDTLLQLGHSVKRTYRLRDIPKGSAVITILDKDCAALHLLRRPKFSISWYQGIIPEEAELTFKGHWSASFRKRFHELLEKYTLKKNDLNIFVSKAQDEHYAKKYGIKGKQAFIMPCFNTPINRDAFYAEKYKSPSFVYAGSMAAWQCVPKMLDIYKYIKKNIPSATLTIFTSQQKVAKELVLKKEVDVKIEYCAPEMMNAKLSKFKYGFLIRDDIKVNQIATPTKINTYMAAGIIPIFSDVIDDYRCNIIEQNPFVISEKNDKALVDAIIEFEKLSIEPTDIYNSHAKIFAQYWTPEYYRCSLKAVVNGLIKE